MKNMYLCAILLIFANILTGQSDSKIVGPLIEGYGSTWEIENAEFQIDVDQKFHMIFDISQKAQNPALINSSINSIARFLNMHVNAGVKMDQIKIIAVVHGRAGLDIMSDEYYSEKFQIKNPNKKLIKTLKDAGVEFYLCGQTMNARGLTRSEILPEVKVALSAMTVIGVYVSQGYALIKF